MSRNTRRFAATWNQFARLTHTRDSLAAERQNWRRWLPHQAYVGFIIQIDDPPVIDQLVAWQQAFRPWFQYDPIPPEQFHISLHYIGMLRHSWWLPLLNLWQRDKLDDLAERVRVAVADYPAFTVQVGPLNAFPNILLAEVQANEALRWLRVRVRKALPLRARPPTPWPYVPHVTLGYWGDQPAAPIRNALRPYRTIAPVSLRVRLIEFTIYTLDPTPNRRDVLLTAQEDIIADYHLKEDNTERDSNASH